MSFNRVWYLCQGKDADAVRKWVKHGTARPKNAKEMGIYKYSNVIPGGQGKMVYWNSLVNDEVTRNLKQHGCLNWCQMSTPLFAAEIPKDRHSLYHSISVSLWGVLDEEKVLRSMLKATLKQHGPLWSKRLNPNQMQTTDLKATDRIVSPHHLFILANIIHRPLIVLSDEKADRFEGIYLPLMSKPIECSKAPVFLACCGDIFHPLLIEVPFDKAALFEMKHTILFPLVSRDLSVLPVMFLEGKEERRAGEILQDYLIVKEIDVGMGKGLQSLLFLDSQLDPLPEAKNTMFSFVKKVRQIKGKEHTKNQNSLLHLSSQSKDKQSDDKEQTKKVESVFTSQNHRPGSLSQCAPLEQSSSVKHNSSGSKEAISGGAGLDTNTNEYHGNQMEVRQTSGSGENGELPYAQMAPTAPEIYEEPISMTPERCVSCKTYRSSINTFPYCHECFQNQNRTNPVPQKRESYLETVGMPLPSQTFSNDRETIPHCDPGSLFTTVNNQHRVSSSYLLKETTPLATLPSNISPTPFPQIKSLYGNDEIIPSHLDSNGLPTMNGLNPSRTVDNQPRFLPSSYSSKSPTASAISRGQVSPNQELISSHRNVNGSQTTNDVSGQMLTSISDQSERFASYSPKNLMASAVSPSQKLPPETGNCNSSSQSHQKQNFKESTGNGELSFYHDYPPIRCGENIIEMSYDPKSFERTHMKDKFIKCASPVCDRLIQSSEQLCERCVRILKVHHNLSNCDKACCTSPSPPTEVFHDTTNLESHTPEPNDVIKFEASGYSSAQSIIQPSVLDQNQGLNFNQHKPNETQEVARSFSPEPEKRYFFPQSLIVTSITSANDTDEIMEVITNDPVSQRFSEIENTFKNNAVKCKTHLCTNFGSIDRNGLCNVCFSASLHPAKSELNSIPIEVSSDENHHGTYGQNMKELESSVKRTLNKCRNFFCTNFGNKLKDGYCNVCYNAMQGDMYGRDDCDGVNNSMDSDETDGLVVSDLESI